MTYARIEPRSPDDSSRLGLGGEFQASRKLPYLQGPPGNREEQEGEAVFDAAHGKILLGFPLRAVRRRPRVAATIFGSVVLLTVMAALFLPRSYDVRTKITAEQNILMPALNNPRRAIPNASDMPTRLATEAILRRENLIGIIKAMNLLDMWPTLQSPAGKLKSTLLSIVKRPPTKEDRINALVGLLEKNLWVTTGDGTVTIGINWVDPKTGFRIVQMAQQNFIDERHASEVSIIGESIAILESHVASARDAIQDALGDVDQTQSRASLPTVRVVRPAEDESARSAPISSNAQEIASVQALLSAKQQGISDLEGARTRRLADLTARLTELRKSFGPAHPDVVLTQEGITALAGDSPQLTNLRNEESQLRARLQALGAAPNRTPVANASEPSRARVVLSRLRSRPDSLEDPRVTYARSRLKIAIANYEDLLDREEGARIELETARAAFKYRFSIITPPEIPDHPATPNIPRLLIVGFFLAFVLAFFVTTAMDILGGRIVEAWQVREMLGLPVFGEIGRA
jgi:uncharacterized protein involved in exopolysaccharide biosynthesis